MRKGFSKIGFTEAMVLTIAVALVLFFIVWQLAYMKAAPEAKALQTKVDFLSGELESINDRLQRTQARLVVSEQEADVIRQANGLLRESESERQAELSQLQSELDFYSRLAGTGGTRSGLNIYQAEVLPTESDRVFQFILTLTQNIQRAAIINGRARVDIEGTMDDRPVTLYWSQISDGETPEPSFRFKYFQQLEGYLTLPEGFSPTRLLFTLEAKGQRKPVVRNYNWNELRDN
jgi:hypothetical protein